MNRTVAKDKLKRQIQDEVDFADADYWISRDMKYTAQVHGDDDAYFFSEREIWTQALEERGPFAPLIIKYRAWRRKNGLRI